MSISRFSVATSTDNMRLFHEFLNTNKAGTFLENMEIELSEDSKTLTITSSTGTVISFVTGTSNQLYAVKFQGNIASQIRPVSDSVGPVARLTGALHCKNGLIIYMGAVSSSDYYGAPQVMITVDTIGEPAIILRDSSGLISGSANPRITSYRVTAANSSSEATVTLTAQYGAQKTSLAPIVPMCNDNSISLPYAYAALHTQASGVGLQAMRMNGSNYITNGVWYIKDGE